MIISPSYIAQVRITRGTRRCSPSFLEKRNKKQQIRARYKIRTRRKKCSSFTDTHFTTTHFYTNTKPNLSNVVTFILIERNGSYVIR